MPYFFAYTEPTQLTIDRKLFISYQIALYMEGYINEKFDHYDSYYPFAWIELLRSIYQETSKMAFVESIDKNILLIKEKISAEALVEFEQGLAFATINAKILFNKLLAQPESFSPNDLKSYQLIICQLGAWYMLDVIVKHVPPSSIDLTQSFATALEMLNPEMMKKIVMLGLDIHNKVSFGECHGYFADYDIKDNWLVYTFASLERLYRPCLSSESEQITTVTTQKIKAIVDFLLASGLDCDELTDLDEKNLTLRQMCKQLIELPGDGHFIEVAVKEVISHIANYPSQSMVRRLR